MIAEPLKILLVEDNFVDADLLQEHLEEVSNVNWELVHVETLAEALQKLTKEEFSIILLDLSLPDEQGLATVRRTHEAVPETPIVVLTGLNDEEAALEAVREGAQDYLIKGEIQGSFLMRALRYAVERGQMLQCLRRSEERYALAVSGAKDGLWDWDLKTNQIYFSPRWKRMLGCSEQELWQEPEEWFNRVHPQDSGELQAAIVNHLRGDTSHLENEHRILHHDQSYRWMLCRGQAIWDSHGKAYRLAGSQTDITERKALEQAIFQEKELAQVTLTSIGDAVIATDVAGRIESFNPAAQKLTGWSFQEAKGKLMREVCHIFEETTRQPAANPAEIAIKEGRVVNSDHHLVLVSRQGQEFAIDDSSAPIRARDGEIVGAVVVFIDITEERNMAKQMSWQANHDALTGLVNRREFSRRVEVALQDANIKNYQHALCYLDLDRFKIVNDTCGHAAGDELLRQVTVLLQSKVRKSDTLARLGGDEFGVLLHQCPLEKALELANTLCSAIYEFRFAWQDKVFAVGVSVGLVAINSETKSLDQVLQAADTACYTAKNQGRNRVSLAPVNEEVGEQQVAEIHWLSRLTEALAKNHFCLYCQPITPLITKDKQEKHYELFLRLVEGEKLVPPMAFIPAAERYNLMSAIDCWVIHRIFSYLAVDPPLNPAQAFVDPIKVFCNSGLPPKTQEEIVYTINISNASINDEQFRDFLHEQFTLYKIPPRSICFEITETVAISNFSKTAELMRDFKSLGCRFSLDNFGSGFSSLAYLKNLPLDYLKIDGNFIKNANNPIDLSIINAISNIGQAMGVEIIAEFVENEEILTYIKSLGLNYAQGFAIAEPCLFLS
ncbi:MAG: EAL domain-containing protein [Spirulinaceae cyanobacterium]